MLKKFLRPFLYNKYLLYQLTFRAIKERYAQSILGYAWVIFNPLIQLGIYTFVFSLIFRFQTKQIPYPIFLLVGLLPWIYLQTSVSTAALSLVDNKDLIKKVAFPREVLPYSVVISKLVDFLFAYLILVVFMLLYRLPFQTSLIYILPVFFIQIILLSGLALLVSATNLFYRDIQYLTTLVLLVWMYLSPVVYPLSLVPKSYLFLYRINPMVGIIEGYRSAMFNQALDAISLLWSLGISLAIFLFSFWFFKRSEKYFADIV